jgi:hypothetical protein
VATSDKDLNEIKQYLLGNLSQEAQQRVEERLLTEDDFFEELLLGEDELIDQYLNASLSDEERERFQHHFLSTPERHQKLRFGSALGRYVSVKSRDALAERVVPQQLKADAAPSIKTDWAERLRAFWGNSNWGLRPALSLMLVAVVSGVLLLSITRRWSSSPPRAFATLALTIDANNRAGGAQPGKVRLTPDIDELRISLMLPERAAPATRYRAELVNVDGVTKPSQIVGQDTQSVLLEVPSAQLRRGQYALKLYKTEADGAEQRIPGSYFFNVE